MSDQNQPEKTGNADKTADAAPPKRIIPRIIIESPHSPEPKKDRKSGFGHRRSIEETNDQPIEKNSTKLSRIKTDEAIQARDSIDNLESLPSPLKRPQKFLRPEQPFFRTQQKQRSVWFDALSELDVELGWSIASNLVYKQLFNNGACPVPYLSDNFFYFPNFVFLQKPLPFVDQFVRGVKNKVLPLGSLLSLATEITKSIYVYLREMLVEEAIISPGYSQTLEDEMQGIYKEISIEIGPVRKFIGRTFEPADVKLSLTSIAQLSSYAKTSPNSPQSNKQTTTKLPKKLYLISSTLTAEFLRLKIKIDENYIEYEKSNLAIGFQCTKYRLASDGTLEEPMLVSTDKLRQKDWIHSINMNWFDECISSKPRIFDMKKLTLGKDLLDEE